MKIETVDRKAERDAGARSAPASPDGGLVPAGDAPAGSAPEPRAAPVPPRGNGARQRRVTRKRLVWGGLGVAAAALIALSLRPTPIEVQTGAVARGPLETTVNAEGVTRVRDRFQIDAPISGRVARISLREGDPVGAGDVVARITPLPLDPQAASQARARVAAAEAGRAEAAARVTQAREAMEQAARTTARIREVASAGGMSEDAVERAELELAAATRDLQAAEARARASDADVAAARAALLDVDPARSTGRAVAAVRAPVAGRVLRVHEQSERIIAAGTPLLELGDAAGLEVVVDVLSTDAVRIAPGAAVRLVEWGGDGALDARVRLVEPSGFTKVSTLGVEEQRVNVIADLIDAPAVLGDGYRVEARIVTWESADVIKVPNSALFRTGTDWGVFVAENGRARLRPVRVGHRGAAEAEVVEGLAEGEQVILFPSDRLQEGARIRSD